MTTIVTAYFKLNISKASHKTYIAWMNNMLTIDNPMVIFCDEQSEQLIKSMRNPINTKIIITKFTDFFTFKYFNTFIEHMSLDHEIRVGHNNYLYMIWNEKTHFLKRAIELNPFCSDYFLWVDIGCFRVSSTLYKKWPNQLKIQSLDNTKLLMLLVEPFTDTELICNNKGSLPSFQYKNRIGGTIFGGHKNSIIEWHNKYYDMLEYFVSIKRFIGKDQSIMNSVYLLNRDSIQLINWVPGCHDKWFYLQDYLL